MRFRATTWWWGRYVTKQGSHWVDQDGKLFCFNSAPPKDLSNQDSNWPVWEIYEDEKHGAHLEQFENQINKQQGEKI